MSLSMGSSPFVHAVPVIAVLIGSLVYARYDAVVEFIPALYLRLSVVLLLASYVTNLLITAKRSGHATKASTSSPSKAGYAPNGDAAPHLDRNKGSGSSANVTDLSNLDPLQPVPLAGSHVKTWGIDLNDFTPEELEEMEANLRKQLEARGIYNPLIRLELYSGCVYVVARVHAPGAAPEDEPIQVDLMDAMPKRIRDRIAASKVVEPPAWTRGLHLYARPAENPEADPAHATVQVLAKGLGPHDPCLLTPCIWSSSLRGAVKLHAAEWEVLGPDDAICTATFDRVAMPDVLTVRLGEFSASQKLVAVSEACVSVPFIPVMLGGGTMAPELQAPLAHVMEYALRPPSAAGGLDDPSDVGSMAENDLMGSLSRSHFAPASTSERPLSVRDFAKLLGNEVDARGHASVGAFLKALFTKRTHDKDENARARSPCPDGTEEEAAATFGDSPHASRSPRDDQSAWQFAWEGSARSESAAKLDRRRKRSLSAASHLRNQPSARLETDCIVLLSSLGLAYALRTLGDVDSLWTTAISAGFGLVALVALKFFREELTQRCYAKMMK